MLTYIKCLLNREEGQGMAEYGLILMLVAVACILIFTNLGNGIKGAIGSVNSSL